MAPPAFEIRDYTPDHYAACRDLWAQLTQHHRDIYSASSIGGDDPGADFDNYLELATRTATWVALSAGAVIGMAGLLIDGDEAEIEPVVVASTHRRQGIGTQLVQHAIAVAAARGMTSVSAKPVARNANALRFFRAAGLSVIGHVELFVRINSDYEGNEPTEAFGLKWSH